MQRKTLFISDLHLDPSRPKITRFFIDLINNSQANTQVDGLYILGDLFEAWIGDDDNDPYSRSIIQALQTATKNGLSVYFMHGNRDFLIGKKFAKETGCQLLPEEHVLNLYGTPVLLMHGDTLCTKDTVYLKARKWCRHAGLQYLFLLLPLSLRRRIAERIRKASHSHTLSISDDKMDVSQAKVESLLRKHHVSVLIHGHTHRPAIHHFSTAEGPASRIVLAAWHDQGNQLVWHENGEKNLEDI